MPRHPSHASEFATIGSSWPKALRSNVSNVAHHHGLKKAYSTCLALLALLPAFGFGAAFGLRFFGTALPSSGEAAFFGAGFAFGLLGFKALPSAKAIRFERLPPKSQTPL